ncbi:MAG: chromosomal replication initiator protein DnaA [Treponema sp.]|nr:chromosomal replication initiator protein DnaA [Treponema sp.]
MYEEAFQYAMNELQEYYKSQNQEEIFNIWFLNSDIKYVEDTTDSITVSVKTNFLLQMISSKGYLSELENKLREILNQSNFKLNCIVDNSPAVNNTEIQEKIEIPEEKKSEKSNEEDKIETPEEEVKESKKESVKILKKHPLLQEEFTFDSFVPGDNSDYAYKASLAVAENPGKKYNPILIYGGSGLGKTHLMQAIGNYIYNNGGEKLKIYYGSAESFTNEFTNSLSSKKVHDFIDKYRNLDVLLLDDIHFLDNKKGIQEELFYTFNALHGKKAQMVFTCDRPIKEIKNMTDRLVSRLSNGLCIDITIPNYETRLAILNKKCQLLNKQLDPQILDYIADNIETNVRDLEAALMTLISYSELVDKPLNLELAKTQLKDIITNSVENVSLETIEKVIAENYQISVSELKGRNKTKKFIIPRQIAIYIARKITEISYTELGDEFGKDHSTIMYNYQKIEDQIKVDPILEQKIDLYIRQIKSYKKS